MSKIVDITGMKFNKLKIIGRAENNYEGKAMWLCECDCGNKKIILGRDIRAGNSKSCGCLIKENVSKKNTKHGLSGGINEYGIWSGIKQRCLNPKSKKYELYGMKGITICDRWKENFNNFIEDMGYRPTSNHSIDRIDFNGNYEPSNCRWANKSMQAYNQRSKSNTGIKGVNFNRHKNTYTASISFEGNKEIKQGIRTMEEAMNFRKSLEIKYFGESSL